MWTPAVRYVLRAYSALLEIDPRDVPKIGTDALPIPVLPESTIMSVCEKAQQILSSRPVMVEFPAPAFVIGDLHGNLFDLIRILSHTKCPPKSRLLFLGDYVDRGQFGIEVCTLLFALYCQFPEHVILLRGNHEFEHVNKTYGFRQDCMEQTGSAKLYQAINTVFSWLPLTAVVNGDIFCVHGGLSPQVTSLKIVETIKRPIQQYEKDDLTCDLVWSDPSLEAPDFLRSVRGSGVTFGVNSIRDFFKQTKMKHIVRAHQCVQWGIERFDGDNCYTVFSCSNYGEFDDNRCGILFINEAGRLDPFSLPALTIPVRAQTKFVDCSGMEPESMALYLWSLEARKEPKNDPRINVKFSKKELEAYPVWTIPSGNRGTLTDEPATPKETPSPVVEVL